MITSRFWATFLAVSSVAFPQTIRGRVLDPSGAPVSGAVVRLTARDSGTRTTAISAADGRYRFQNTGASGFLLSASAPGFAAPEAAPIELRGNEDIERDLRLALDRVETRVVVTATSTAQTTEEIAKAFDVVDSAEIERRAEFSIAEALRLVPGVRIAQLGGPGAQARIHTRGLRSFDTSVLIDGFRFRDAAAPQGDALGFFSDFLTVDTERIEILRGSGSSLYGTHAIGGVVNIVTNAGGGATHGGFSTEGGGLGTFRSTAKVSGGFLSDRLRYSGGLAHMNVWSGVDGNDPSRNSTAQGFAQYVISPRTTVSGRFFGNDSFTALNGTPFALAGLPNRLPVPAIAGSTFSPNPDDPDNHRTGRFYSGLAGLTHRFAPGVGFRVQYQGLSTGRQSRNGPGGTSFQPLFNSRDQWESRIDTAQGRFDIARLRRHTMTAGYEFERERFGSLSTNQDPNAASRLFAQTEIAQSSHAVFAQDQIRFARDRLLASVGGRMQSFVLSRPAFAGGAPRYERAALDAPPVAYTGDISLAWLTPSKGTKIRAHVGNSYRSPTLFERFGTGFFAGTFTPYGDPRLSPERSLAMDAGFDQYIANARARISGTYFYTRLQQVIGFDFSGLINRATDPFGRSSGYRNTGGGLARGMEWSVEATPLRNLLVRTGYTFTKAQERNSTLIGGSTRSIRISDHMFTALVTYRAARGFDVALDLFTASNYWWQFFAGGSRPFEFAGPKKADLVLSYTKAVSDRWNAQFYARIDNVFNRVYFEDGFRTPKAWAVIGLKLTR
jgi:iron complex outermembrane receptor protein